MRLRAEKKTDKACKKMAQAIAKSHSFPDAYAQLGQWYFEARKYPQAADVFRKAVARCANGKQRFGKPLVKTLIACGYADEALQVIYSHTDDPEWRKLKAQAEFVKTALINQSRIWPENLVRINTPDAELYPCMSADTALLYYTRRVNNIDEDLYYSAMDTCGDWCSGQNLGSINTPDPESAQFISPDGHYMFFTRCDNRSWDAWTEGGCDLLMAYRVAKDSEWTTPQPFGATINTPAYEGQPSLSPDNRELYFVSDRPGGYGGMDIWISRFDNGLWQLPVNAGPNINTAGNETAPFISVDNRTLFFASDGWPGMGGSDIFMSKRINEHTWDKARNLGYPINTASDEKSQYVTMDGTRMYFASDRNGPAGNFDLYQTTLPHFLQPIATGNIEGYVYDSLTSQRLNYTVMLVCNAATGDTLYQFQSNRGDASFLISVPVGKTYAIHSWHVDYTQVHDTLNFDTSYLHRPLVHNVVMLPSDYKEFKPIHDSLVATLHFDVNRVELADSDVNTLRAALEPLLANKGLVVFINAYTDNTGTPMINEELSYKRAGIVSKVIESFGIDDTQIQAKGWGEAKMIAPNDNEEGQRRNRRVEIIVRR
jgi:outer membrane protein OmpA-like peptidoglycan-associated protein